MLNFIITNAIMVVVLGIVWQSLWRHKEREVHVLRQKAETVLAQLARGEPLAPDVELLFPAEHFGTGLPVVPADRERFVRSLHAGPYRYPSFGSTSEPRGSWARRGFLAPQVSHQGYIMADGQGFNLFARRDGEVWQIAIVM